MRFEQTGKINSNHTILLKIIHQNFYLVLQITLHYYLINIKIIINQLNNKLEEYFNHNKDQLVLILLIQTL